MNPLDPATWPAWLVVALDVAAAYRITRLVTKDTITEPWRDRWIRWAYRRAGADMPPITAARETCTELVGVDDAAPKLAVLVTCPWCAGMWVSLLVAGVRLVSDLAGVELLPDPEPVSAALYAMALSALAGLIAQLDQD